MLSITKIESSSKQQKATGRESAGYHFYLDSTLVQDDGPSSEFASYVQGQDLAAPLPFWVGKGSQELNLHGPASLVEVDRLAHGFHPKTGLPLIAEAGKDHVMGLDLTLSPPKAVSAVFAAADGDTQREIIIAVQQSARVALEYVQTKALTRHGRAGREKRQALNTLAACYTHFASRELDPQLHVHGFFFNLGQSTDKKWSAVEPRAMFEHKMAAGILFRVELAAQLNALGFSAQPTPDGYFTLDGIQESQCRALSTRSQQIADYLAAVKKTGANASESVPASARAKGFAALNTRSGKAEPPLQQLLGLFKQKAAALGLTVSVVLAMRKPLVVAASSRPHVQMQEVSGEALRDLSEVSTAFEIDENALLDELTREKSCLSPADALVVICKLAMGRWSARRCLDELERVLGSARVLTLGQTDTLTPVLTTRATADLEQGIVDRAKQSALDQRHRISVEQVDAQFDTLERDLSARVGVPVCLEAQRAAARYMACETGGHAFLEGWAGTGKTTLLRALSAAYKQEGLRVVGCAQSASAALNLGRETKVPSCTIAQLLLGLERGRNKLDDRTILLLDEAGMVGSREFDLLQKAAVERGAKLICVGDPKQLQPVEGGAIFGSLMRELGKAELSGIQRQQTNITPLLDWLDEQALLHRGVRVEQVKALRALPEECRLSVARQLCETSGDERLMHGFKLWQERFDYEWARGVVRQLATGDALSALTTLDEKGKIHSAEDAMAVRLAIIEAWAKDKAAASQKTMIAATRLEVADLNTLARHYQVNAGLVDDQAGVDLLVLHRDGTTSPRRIAAGDRLVFTKNDPRLGVVNGAVGTLRALRPTDAGATQTETKTSTSTANLATPLPPQSLDEQPRVALVVELDEPNANGQRQVVVPASFAQFDLAYCLTNHKSQGRTFDSAYVLVNPNATGREWMYVAASRSRFSTALFFDQSALQPEPSEHVPASITPPLALLGSQSLPGHDQDGHGSLGTPRAPGDSLSRADLIRALAARIAPSRAKLTTLDFLAVADKPAEFPTAHPSLAATKADSPVPAKQLSDPSRLDAAPTRMRAAASTSTPSMETPNRKQPTAGRPTSISTSPTPTPVSLPIARPMKCQGRSINTNPLKSAPTLATGPPR